MGKIKVYTDTSLNRQEFWQNIGSDYYSTNWIEATNRRKFIAQLVNNNNIGSVLELGCNDGVNLHYILEKCPSIKACGIDICENAIQYGREVRKNTADMQVCSLYDLSRFEDKSFDVVFTCGVLGHIQESKVQPVVRDMVRIARHHTFHIELAGAESILAYGDTENKIPHTSVHHYMGIYKSLNIIAKKRDVKKLGINNKGLGKHLIWTNLGDKNMIVVPFKESEG